MYSRFFPAFILLVLLNLHVTGQQDILPHFPSVEEEDILPEYLKEKIALSSLAPVPPPGKVRTMAEWEQVQAVIITWAGHSTILKEIVRHAVKECKVFIITTNPANVDNQLETAGILLDSVQYISTPFNSIWVRDYGPWTVYKNDVDSLYLIDWIYNRPREQDDVTPVAVADHVGVPIYEAIQDPDDLVHTGGNHLPDGMGTAFSSMLVLEENPDKTEDEIDSIVRKYLGVDQYIKFPTLPYDGIHHLDMHMRVIDEETIIFGEYPDGVADGPQINANIQYLQDDFRTPFGNPYNIVRIPMPPEGTRYPDEGGDYRTYTNSLFINKTILVPTYEEKYDTTALRIYRENLPGYNVVGINCNSIIPSLGALHCITKLVGTEDPLWIAHPRLRDTYTTDSDHLVKAIIKHRSGIAQASLHYQLSGDSVYIEVPLVLRDTLLNLWEGTIPVQSAGSEIRYYIEAIANDGKVQVRPIVAPEGYFKFRIHGVANQAPSVAITYPDDEQSFLIDNESITVTFDAFDVDGEINEATLFVNGDSTASLFTPPYEFPWFMPAIGTYTISVRVKDNQGAEAESQIITIHVEEATSTVRINGGSLCVFPNPVSDVLWLESERIGDATINVRDLYGRVLDVIQVEDEGRHGLDFSQLVPGAYSVTVSIADKVFSVLIIRN